MFRNGQLAPRSKHRTGLWKYFAYSQRKDQTTCAVDFCTTILSGNNTSQLRRHLQQKHPVIYAMLPRDGVRSSGRGTSEEKPSPQVPGIVTETLRKKFKKKLKTIMDSLLRSTVSEVTNAFEVFTLDHQMVVKQKIEECSMLRLKLEMAESKLREQNGMWGKMEDVTYTSGQMMPELTVNEPDDWCAPLACENVADPAPSTSDEAREDRSSSLCSLSVSLWRLPDIKQEVQDDGYQLDGPLSCPQDNLEHTEAQKKPLSTTKHSRPRSSKATRNLNGSIKPKAEQPMDRRKEVKMEVPNTEKVKGKKRKLQAIKLETEPLEEKIVGKTYRCKFCGKYFDTEVGRSVHLRIHKKCTGCQTMFRYPSHLRLHKKKCTGLKAETSLDTSLDTSREIKKTLCLRKRRRLSTGEDTSNIFLVETQDANRKKRAQKRSKVGTNSPKKDKSFLCTNCHKSFCSIVWLKNHLSKHLPCPKCKKIFCSSYILKTHIYKDHPKNPDKTLEPSEAVERVLGAVSSKEKHVELGSVSSKEKHVELGAVSAKAKHVELGSVSSKEKHVELGAVSAKSKHVELGAVSAKSKHVELGAVSAKSKHVELGSVSSKEKHVELGAVSAKSKHVELGAVLSKGKHVELGAVSAKSKHVELGAVSSKAYHSELGAVSSKANHSELGAASSKTKGTELGAVSSKEKSGAVSPKEKQCCEGDSKNQFG